MRVARILGRRRRKGCLIPLADALEALGRDGIMRCYVDDVPVSAIVGSAERSADFDSQFRLLNNSLRKRWQRLFDLVAAGVEPPPVELVQLGDLFFVRDGHHRVSVARALGREWVTARVEHICTIAYARSCLRMAHLPTKDAERRFLQRIPLPDQLRRELWLDDASAWLRLADSAEAWGLRYMLKSGEVLGRDELAKRWWTEEVEPVVADCRRAGMGTCLPDVQVYITALAMRDRLGLEEWPECLAAGLSARCAEPMVSSSVPPRRYGTSGSRLTWGRR